MGRFENSLKTNQTEKKERIKIKLWQENLKLQTITPQAQPDLSPLDSLKPKKQKH